MSVASRLRRMRKQPPEGWDLIEPTLDEFEAKMREAETDPHEGKRRTETLWPIFKIHHQRSRYIYDLFYKREVISKELYQFCLDTKLADAKLIAKWKKQGYENLCCLRCIQTRDTNFGTNCICRVPKSKLDVVSFLSVASSNAFIAVAAAVLDNKIDSFDTARLWLQNHSCGIHWLLIICFIDSY
uniref:Protein BUD31 homolog n=1 Tax=Ascaris lumbricoides TaxID=6252 RepID=A0A0M3HQN8_ASCLU